MKAQLQAAEREPQLVCSYCTLQVLLNFISEHRPFCFHPPFGDAVAVACLLSKMRPFHLSRLWTREEELSIVLAVCVQSGIQQRISILLLHVCQSSVVFSS